MIQRYLVRSIRGDYVIAAFETEEPAREFFERSSTQQRYAHEGLYLERLVPRVIEVKNPVNIG